MYVPSLISIPFVLSKIWHGQTSIMEKWLWGDNSVNIQGRIIDFGFCPSAHCHLSINQDSLKSFCTFQDNARTGIQYEK